MSKTEKNCVSESLIILTEKKAGFIKGRPGVDGNPQCQWIDQERVSSTTVKTDRMIMTSII